MQEKGKVVCFTGHREIEVEHFEKIYELIPDILEDRILEGYTVFKAGGALGFDMLCEIAVIELKKAYPEIELQLILPYPSQPSEWDEGDRDIYNAILECADSVHYIGTEFTEGCMSERNRQIVDGSDLCIAYLENDASGTKYTVEYAKKLGVEIINLYDIVK